MIIKRIFVTALTVVMLFGFACKKEMAQTNPAVDVILLIAALAPPCDASGPLYHEITLDYRTSGITDPTEMGKYFGQQTLAAAPDFEKIFDWYIHLAATMVPYQTMIDRAKAIKTQLPADYRAEIEGLITQCTGTENKLLDGKLSPDEVYLLEVLPDVWISAQCSSVAVFGSSSATGSTIIGRNLEWFGGFPYNYLSKLQAVVTIKNSAVGRKDVCLIGYLGFLGCITGFNTDGLFGAIQVSDGDTSQYDATEKGSYNMNLRTVLETCNNVDAAGAYLLAESREYAAGHLFVFADPDKAQVFEYDPTTSAPHKDMREWNSTLKDGITWIDPLTYTTIGAVNSFVLPGFYDNHKYTNVSRWNTMRNQLQLALDDTVSPDKVTVGEVKKIITYYQGKRPGAVDGDLYRGFIQQTIIYQPGALDNVNNAKAEVHFHPLCVQSPGYPSTIDGFFTDITADF